MVPWNRKRKVTNILINSLLALRLFYIYQNQTYKSLTHNHNQHMLHQIIKEKIVTKYMTHEKNTHKSISCYLSGVYRGISRLFPKAGVTRT
jgi:hypothetical protein